MKIISRLPLVLPCSFVVALGCAGESTDAAGTSTAALTGSPAVDDGSDVHSAQAAAANLSSSLIGGDGSQVSLASANELVARQGGLALANLGFTTQASFGPAGCLTVNATPQSAQYVFNGCTGPYGLVTLTGEIDVTSSSSAPNQLTLQVSTTGFHINGNVISWQGSASVTGSGTARDMIWDAKMSGTTALGRSFKSTNHQELKWTLGTACVSIAGQSDGTVAGRELKTEILNYSVCAGRCPQAGSELRITDVPANKVFDVKWNAVNATYTGPAGNAVNFIPACML